MLDISVFKFTEIVQTVVDIPIVLISELDKPELLAKAINNGARDLICTPTIQQLKLIWKYVQCRNISASNKNKRVEDESGNEKTNSSKNDDSEHTSKKPRWRWTDEFREKFICAVNQLGLDMASPKKILELMDVPNLSKNSVSSYLQKFRDTVKDEEIEDWTNVTSKRTNDIVQNQKFSFIQPSSSSRPNLSTNQIRESEFQGQIGRVLKSQSPGKDIVTQQSFPGFRMQNFAPTVHNENNHVLLSGNSNLIGQSNVHIPTSPQLVENSNFMAQNLYMHRENASTLTRVNNVSTGPNLSRNEIQESEFRGPNGRMLKSQLPGQAIVPEQSFPRFKMQNYAPAMCNESNRVTLSRSSNLIRQSNVHVSSFPQLAENTNYSAQNPSHIHRDDASIFSGVNSISTGQNVNYFDMVNRAQNIPAPMQHNYSSVMNRTDNNFRPMVRNQLNIGQKYASTAISHESSAPVARSKNLLPPGNYYSLLNQWRNNAVRIGQNDSYMGQSTAPMNNWLGTKPANIVQNYNAAGHNFGGQGINNFRMMQNSNDLNRGQNCLSNFTGCNQNYNATGTDYAVQGIGGFRIMQNNMVGQNGCTGLPYQGHDILNSIDENIMDQNHNPMGNNYVIQGIDGGVSIMQNHQIGINEDMGVAYPGQSSLGAHGNFVNGNPLALENNSTVQGIDAAGTMQNDTFGVSGNIGDICQVESSLNAFTGNDGAGSSERCVNEDDFVADLLNLDAELDGANN